MSNKSDIRNVESSTDLVSVSELASYTQETLTSEKHMLTGRKFISLKGSQLSLDGEPFKHNEVIAVIIDHVIEQTYYEENYDSQNSVMPVCYSFGRSESELVPHELVKNPLSDKCVSCPNYQWGSKIVNGRPTAGKACQSRRRLALIYAGEMVKNEDTKNEKLEAVGKEALIGSQIVYLRLPVTAITAFSKYVKNVATVTKRPPFGVYTRITVGPDFDIKFNTLDLVPLPHLRTLIEMHNAAREDIMFPYDRKENTESHKEGHTEHSEVTNKEDKIVKDYSKSKTKTSNYVNKF